MQLDSPFKLVMCPVSFEAGDEEKVSKAIDTLKHYPIACDYDPITKEITFIHEVSEVKAIIAALKLEHVFSSNLSLLESSLSLTFDQNMVDGANYMIRGDLSDAFLERLEELNIAASRWMKTQKALPCIASPSNLENPLDLLAIHQGLVIGEVHTDCAARRYIIQNMHEMRNRGVTTLFLEHFCYDSFQPLLDRYHDQEGDELFEPLASYAQRLDLQCASSKGGSFCDLLQAAKRSSIRVVGLDTTVSYSAGYNRKLGITNVDERYLAMNFVAFKIIKQISASKFIALMGSGHVGTVRPGIFGVADLLHLPSLVIETGKADEPILQRNVSKLHQLIQKVSLFLELPEPLQLPRKHQKI
jgi:hypothetical protein